MSVLTSKRITLLRTFGIFVLGLLSGIQLALYLYDYYDDGVAELSSLLIGIAMVVLSSGFILYTYRSYRAVIKKE